MDTQIIAYNQSQVGVEAEICAALAEILSEGLPEAERKIWHAHPVWFLNGNPICGYSKLKAGIQLMFWSGQSFDEPKLKKEGKFKAATICYTHPDQIDADDLHRWIDKARTIQWDYKNIVKRRGVLERLV
jgi:hypothetical protein